MEHRRSRGAQPRALRNVPAVVAYSGGATLVAGKPRPLVFPYQRQARPLGQKAPLLDITPPSYGSAPMCVGAPRRTWGAGPWLGRPRRSPSRGLKVMDCVLTRGGVRSDARSALSPGHSPPFPLKSTISSCVTGGRLRGTGVITTALGNGDLRSPGGRKGAALPSSGCPSRLPAPGEPPPAQAAAVCSHFAAGPGGASS